MIGSINPFFAARSRSKPPLPTRATASRYARLPLAPVNASPVPHLTSLYHFDRAGEYGDRAYPGNCGGNLIKDLLRYFNCRSVFDPMTGSGTCRDVCREMGVYCYSSDLHQNIDACDASQFPRDCFEFAWIHPPYFRQKLYTQDRRDLSRAPTLAAFLERYRLLIANCAGALVSGGKLAILMGDYCDREAGFVPLTYYTKELAFGLGLRQHCTDIIRFSHGASSSRKVYRSSFIPGLHDVCMVFERVGPGSDADRGRALLLRADLAIVPCKASMLEVRALAAATEVLRQAQDIRAGVPKAVIVLSMVGKNYRLTADMKDAAAALNLPLASRAMILRQIYADAPGQGAVVWNMGSRASAAADEVNQIFREILPDAAQRRAARVSVTQ